MASSPRFWLSFTLLACHVGVSSCACFTKARRRITKVFRVTKVFSLRLSFTPFWPLSSGLLIGGHPVLGETLSQYLYSRILLARVAWDTTDNASNPASGDYYHRILLGIELRLKNLCFFYVDYNEDDNRETASEGMESKMIQGEAFVGQR